MKKKTSHSGRNTLQDELDETAERRWGVIRNPQAKRIEQLQVENESLRNSIALYERENLQQAEKLAKIEAIRHLKKTEWPPFSSVNLEPIMYAVALQKDGYKRKIVFEGTLKDCYLYVKNAKISVGQSLANKLTSTKRMVYLKKKYCLWIQ